MTLLEYRNNLESRIAEHQKNVETWMHSLSGQPQSTIDFNTKEAAIEAAKRDTYKTVLNEFNELDIVKDFLGAAENNK
jgi:hypothetical protein